MSRKPLSLEHVLLLRRSYRAGLDDSLEDSCMDLAITEFLNELVKETKEREMPETSSWAALQPWYNDLKIFDHLVTLLLDQPWHDRCEIIPDYMPPFPGKDTQPRMVVRFNDGTKYAPFLRFSHGPKQGFFWDAYGDDLQNVALAILAIHQAPAPVSVAPYEFKIAIGRGNTKDA